jgi:D-alanyl-D-alanine carboxypeptidase
VVADHADPSAVVEVTVNGPELSMTTDATVMGLEPGDRLTVRDLLYGMLLPSGNDAAIALAEHVAGSLPAFVELMNQKAATLGLSDTSFANPHGLDDPGLYSSAHDMALLGLELLRDPLLARIVRTSEYQPAWDKPPVTNLNLLLKIYPGAIGIKTGFTDTAGQTIVAAAERDGRTLVATVLHSEDLYVDAVELLEWGFANTSPACDGVVGETSAARSAP